MWTRGIFFVVVFELVWSGWSLGHGLAVRTKGDPTEHDPHVGFRCAQDAPPVPEAGRAERP